MTEIANYKFSPWIVRGDRRIVASEATWKKPLKWNKAAEQSAIDASNYNHRFCGDPDFVEQVAERPRVFCASLADVFEDWHGPMVDAQGRTLYRDGDDWHTEGPPSSRLTMVDVRQRLFRLIDATPNLDWLVLTKRPENIARMMPIKTGDCYGLFPGGDPRRFRPDFDECSSDEVRAWREACKAWDVGAGIDRGPSCATIGDASAWTGKGFGIGVYKYEEPRDNLWLGVSVENQAAADERIPHLLKVPAAVRFLSMEPLLGPVDVRRWLPGHCETCGSPCKGHGYHLGGSDHFACGYEVGNGARHSPLTWVIVGGESGPNARPLHPDWVRLIRNQCQAAGVPFFFKQWGEWIHAHPAELHLSPAPLVDWEGLKMHRVGKRAAGRLLDGREWSEIP